MSTEPTPFAEYEVEGVGTVIDPQGEPGYRVRLPDGRVTGFPAASGDPSEANAAADIAAAIADPTPRIMAFVAAATVAMQTILDERARVDGYDGILSAASYADDPTGEFAAQGAAYKAWRSSYWAAGYEALNAHNPANPLPSMESFLAGLPDYIAP